MIVLRNLAISVVAAVLFAHVASAQNTRIASTASTHPSGVISFHAHVDAWIKGYTQWTTSHPELLFGPSSKHPQSSGSDDTSLRIDLRWPFLAYFKPNGDLVYVGMDSGSNVRFLQGLPRSAQTSANSEDVYPPQPPLNVYFDIFPDLQRYKARMLTQKHPVLLTICQDIAPACKDQESAAAEIKKRLTALQIQLVEVEIVPNNKQ